MKNSRGFLNGEHGFALPFAIVLVMLLGSMVLSTQIFEGILNKATTKGMDRREAFYSAEMTAWTDVLIRGTEGAPVTCDNNYVLNLPATLAQDQYSAGYYPPGRPANVRTTKNFDLESQVEAHTYIRRYFQNLSYRTLSSSSDTVYCGVTGFSKQNYQNCLVASVPPLGCSLSPVTQTITEGQSAVLTMTTNGSVASATFSGSGVPVSGGTFTVTPLPSLSTPSPGPTYPYTQTYVGTVTDGSGNAKSCSAQVILKPGCVLTADQNPACTASTVIVTATSSLPSVAYVTFNPPNPNYYVPFLSGSASSSQVMPVTSTRFWIVGTLYTSSYKPIAACFLKITTGYCT